MQGVAGTPSERRTDVSKPKFKLPDGYVSEEAFLQEMREIYADNETFSIENKIAALDDLNFLVGNQWNAVVAQKRYDANKPVLTFNRLPAFVGQVVGSRRLNETEIKIRPDAGSDVNEAKVREGIIRNVHKTTLSKLAFDNALMGSVSCGVANFELDLEYAADDVFDQNIAIKPIVNHLAVLWDYSRLEPTGRDAGNCFVIDTMDETLFYQQYPWATPSDIATTLIASNQMNAAWMFEGNVRIVDYWRMRTEKRTLAMMQNGKVVDITDELNTSDVFDRVQLDQFGEPIMREVDRRYAEKYVCSGTDILAGPYRLPIDRIPVFRVPGWEIWIGEKLMTWGLVRFMKDPQNLHNYWRSVIAERLMQTPKGIWMAADTAVSGREKAWRNSHLSDDSLLIWNSDSGQRPERIPPAQFEQAFAMAAEMTNQDLKDISNIHEANLGMPSNEVSGIALMTRQRISDTGTITYHDNLASAIEECGRVANDLLFVVYDTPRIVKILGEDGVQLLQKLNFKNDPESIDITSSKYVMTCTTGPSFETKRVEAAENMKNLANAMPNILAVAADKIVEAQDWPGASEIAERIRMTMPPYMLKPNEVTAAVKAAQQAQAQQQAGQSQAQQQDAAAKYMKDFSSAQLNTARAHHYQVQTAAIPAKVQNESLTAASEAAAREIQSRMSAAKA